MSGKHLPRSINFAQLSALSIYTPPSGEPEVVYADEALLVVNKPVGLLAVPGRGEDKQDCLSARLQKQFSDALVVHRLDMATSGLMVFARGTAMQRKLSQMFREHEVDKRYAAVVTGKLDLARIQYSPSPTLPQRERGQSLLPPLGEGWDEGWGEVNLPIAADWPNRPLRKIDMEAGKPSLTRYRLLAYDAATDTSRVELKPITGRTHQLRVHMAAIGHPILGDVLYGDVASAPRLLLHASSLRFAHPRTGDLLNFVRAGLS